MTWMRKLGAVALLCGIVCIASGRGADAAGAASAATGTRVDINAASVDELVQLPGIGPALAQAIVEHRTKAPFQRAEELRDVKGIGDRLFEQLKDQVTVGNPAPAPKDRDS